LIVPHLRPRGKAPRIGDGYRAIWRPFGIIAAALALNRWQPDAGRGASIGWGAAGYFAAGLVVSLFFVFS
jgi:hypothetical protein